MPRASIQSRVSRAVGHARGVELAHVDSLNLLQLAPGGHLGRFCVWTQGAFARLDALYGTHSKAATEKTRHKVPYRLPQLQMTNSDLSRLINSDEVQSKVNPPKQGTAAKEGHRGNPLKRDGLMEGLNPYAAVAKKHFKDKQAKAEADKAALVKARRDGKGPKKAKRTKEQQATVDRKRSFYGEMVADES